MDKTYKKIELFSELRVGDKVGLRIDKEYEWYEITHINNRSICFKNKRKIYIIGNRGESDFNRESLLQISLNPWIWTRWKNKGN